MSQDVICRHGVAMDVHCCGCHSGFIFDRDEHDCEEGMEQNSGMEIAQIGSDDELERRLRETVQRVEVEGGCNELMTTVVIILGEAREALKRRRLMPLQTRQYSCGCSATGSVGSAPVPYYCPDHPEGLDTAFAQGRSDQLALDRPYMQHLMGCDVWCEIYLEVTAHSPAACTCGLSSHLKAGKPTP